MFPNIENPLMPIMEDTPITPTALNLPSIDQSMMTQSQAANQFSNLTIDQKNPFTISKWLKTHYKK